MRVLYLEPFTGISGDMLLGALVDVGVPVEVLREQIERLDLAGRVTLEARRVERGGVAGTKVDVLIDGRVEEPVEAAGHGPEHGHDHHHQGATHVAELIARLEGSRLEPEVKAGALEVVRRLAEAEARVHGVEPEQVHLHEAGALDALVDITAAVAGVRWLGPERILSAPPRDGRGQVESAHGTLPVPVPAVAFLLEGIPQVRLEVPHELVTPTGAALLVSLVDEFPARVAIVPERVGYGAGGRQLTGRPNLLRLSVGRLLAEPAYPAGGVVEIETVVDDLCPEIWPHVMERLMAAGARDVWMSPVIMRKGRPGVALTVLAEPHRRPEMEEVIFRETGSLGLRLGWRERSEVPRATGRLNTRLGQLAVKLARLPGQQRWQVHPEYEVCREAALRLGVPLREVYAAVREAAAEEANLTPDQPEEAP